MLFQVKSHFRYLTLPQANGGSNCGSDCDCELAHKTWLAAVNGSGSGSGSDSRRTCNLVAPQFITTTRTTTTLNAAKRVQVYGPKM